MGIRFATPEDFDSCVELLPKAWNSSRMKARVGYLLMSRSALVDTDHDGSVNGFFLLEIDFFDEKTLYLRTAVVRENRRRSGVGTALLKYSLEYAKNNNFRRIFLDALEGNEQITRDGVEKFGFKQAGYIDNMHDEGGKYFIYSLRVADYVQ
ncbi:GNAT family N-acetyltransferase [Nonomuraea sp. NPDC049758]|uniref:GNAT family N-acetyltransferase n=1 Tax=Nonomuraea sp. NPDC049758 TaxID=3154360 RepID=UPI003437EF3B